MQSGISASEELLSAFNEVQSSAEYRGLIAGISKESLVPITKIKAGGSFEDDLVQLDGLTKDNEAAYILLRQRDSQAEGSFVAITYVPDTAHVRQKMLFASTRNTLLRELGTEKFGESIFATMKAEFTAEGFKKHASHAAKPAPLTEEEQVLKGVKEAEAEASMGTMSRASHVAPTGGFGMPSKPEAREALQKLSNSRVGLVQLGLDLSTEEIILIDHTQTEARDIGSVISKDSPRYSFFVFTHNFEGQEQSPIVFLYTCPTNSKIKERMVYAASSRSVVALAEKEGLTVAKRLEEAEADEITEARLMEEFHPKREDKGGFQRPKRPGRK